MSAVHNRSTGHDTSTGHNASAASKKKHAIQASCSRASEYLLPTLFVAGAALCLWETREMSQLGAVFPAVISLVVIAAGLLRLGQLGLRGVVANHERGSDSSSDPSSDPSAGSTPRRLALVGIMLAWALALPWLGFLLTGLASFVGLMVVAQYRRWHPRRLAGHLATGAVLVAFFYALFALVLNVPLPAGRWFTL
ncbi:MULTISPECIES: tripartite tricarboxylate transporter TctB family protein [unclassified Halomonas]|uniref:tripartite tricarboxylate transporter TctB family protein n=1 Tax=unclassified Halomonas TaxID=2609666 RepID=UPI0006965A56|nr:MULTISPECIES: tripartite tricarboxylate transporter TctB family protein [unclassified Halomonas]MCO7215391.1 tripartite tricarboxylate transporter TctB family protein [Halomonas sp. OfavH-34-E]